MKIWYTAAVELELVCTSTTVQYSAAYFDGPGAKALLSWSGPFTCQPGVSLYLLHEETGHP